MTKRERCLVELVAIGPGYDAVRAYLTEHSNLPGPRGNLELAHAFADWASDPLVDDLADEPDEYLRFCAVLALGERLSKRDDAPAWFPVLEQNYRDDASEARKHEGYDDKEDVD